MINFLTPTLKNPGWFEAGMHSKTHTHNKHLTRIQITGDLQFNGSITILWWLINTYRKYYYFVSPLLKQWGFFCTVHCWSPAELNPVHHPSSSHGCSWWITVKSILIRFSTDGNEHPPQHWAYPHFRAQISIYQFAHEQKGTTKLSLHVSACMSKFETSVDQHYSEEIVE